VGLEVVKALEALQFEERLEAEAEALQMLQAPWGPWKDEVMWPVCLQSHPLRLQH
jgi:hypothetical protein